MLYQTVIFKQFMFYFDRYLFFKERKLQIKFLKGKFNLKVMIRNTIFKLKNMIHYMSSDRYCQTYIINKGLRLTKLNLEFVGLVWCRTKPCSLDIR